MSITITLSGPAERRLAERAAVVGKTPAAFLAEIAERELAPERLLAEVVAPFAQSFAEGGMTEEGLDALIDEARHEVWWDEHGTAT